MGERVGSIAREHVIDHGRWSILGVGIDAVDYSAAVERIMLAAHERKRLTTSALAVHGVMTGALNAAHKHRLGEFDLVVPDGQPVRWALRVLHGVKLPDRVYGPELTLRVLARSAQEGVPVFLYGSRKDTLVRLQACLEARFPALRIVGSEESRFRRIDEVERQTLTNRIEESGARIVLVGLGCPRQEVFAYEMGEDLAMPLLAVGAAFDFHAGTVTQAPRWMQQRGLEWLFRLVQEPKRLWRRYLLLNPLYVLLVILQLLGLAKLLLPVPSPPERLERFG